MSINKEEIQWFLGLVMSFLLLFSVGLGVVFDNNEYCKEEEHKEEWNCITEKDLLGGKE